MVANSSFRRASDDPFTPALQGFMCVCVLNFMHVVLCIFLQTLNKKANDDFLLVFVSLNPCVWNMYT